MRMFRTSRRKSLLLLLFAVLLFYMLTHRNRTQNSRFFQLPGQWDGSQTLTWQSRQFLLKGKPFRILSGAIHYFRVPPEYWRDRLRKLKAAGLNTVESYVPWNLHEESRGRFRFEAELDLVAFIRTAQEEGLYFILRPGPYICAEWDLGGLPAWLLSDPKMRLRTTYENFTVAVEKYFEVLIPLILPLQHGSGGPIIMVQVENEFGSYRQDPAYVPFIAQLLKKLGVNELLFTSDGFEDGRMEAGVVSGVFAAVNDRDDVDKALDFMKCSEAPLMVAEFWSGWFDHWMEPHSSYSVGNFSAKLSTILLAGASVNFYMFHGGTNFGFMNGANLWIDESGAESPRYQPTTTSYDYDAPISEQGQLSPKFYAAAELLSTVPGSSYNFDRKSLEKLSKSVPAKGYGVFEVKEYLQLTDLLEFVTPWTISKLAPMEEICEHLVPPTVPTTTPCRPQNHGFIVYRTQVAASVADLSFNAKFADRAHVIIDGKTVATMESFHEEDQIELQFKLPRTRPNDLIFLIENMGRVNYAKHPYTSMDRQRKGFLSGTQVLLDRKPVASWQVYMLDFAPDFLHKVDTDATWVKYTVPGSGVHINPSITQPALYRIPIDRQKVSARSGAIPADTFINYQGWKKGVAFISGFNLGRYWNQGPQRTLYVPGPRFFGPPGSEESKKGPLHLILFELHQAVSTISLVDRSVFRDRKPDEE